MPQQISLSLIEFFHSKTNKQQNYRNTGPLDPCRSSEAITVSLTAEPTALLFIFNSPSTGLGQTRAKQGGSSDLRPWNTLASLLPTLAAKPPSNYRDQIPFSGETPTRK